jgi:hypothetical protein
MAYAGGFGKGRGRFLDRIYGIHRMGRFYRSAAPAFCEAVCGPLSTMGDFSIVSPRFPDFPGKSIGYFEGP